MTRTILSAVVLAIAVAGCSATSPVAPKAFDTKLLNLFSLGSQQATQLNYVPNNQVNLSGQSVSSNTSAMFPILSGVGTGIANASNETDQTIDNEITQEQGQNQLVF